MSTAMIGPTGMQSVWARDEHEGTATPRTCERLDTWKEIASYLRRSIRCAQRWEKTEGLPIFRHLHPRGATVYAYREELDAWWRGSENTMPEKRIGAG